MNEKTKELTRDILLIFSVPVVIMFILALVYSAYGLYPLGNGTIAWCDMTQQVIPMTCDLKDILTGKAGLFLNMQNAGGMSMIGVIFFFVASPLNLLTLFVDNSELVLFVNVLTMLKMMLAGLTAVLFFRRCFKNTPRAFAWCLSVSYALCGYAVIYYQNSIWLDVMYLFPLLMMGIHSLVTKNKLAGFVISLSALAIVNYYICYMIAIFCILFFALLIFRDKEKKYLQAGFLFIVGSLISVLLTAVVWLPSLLQFFASGRTTSITENITSASFLAQFKTSLPLIFYSACAIVICLICVFDKKEHTRQNKTMLIMLTVMLIPLVIEPINLMWHTGSYMSFPCRFAFMTVFIMLICSAQLLENGSAHISQESVKKKGKMKYLVPALCGAVCLLSVILVRYTIKNNAETIEDYARKLWSDDISFAIEFKIFIITAIGFGICFVCYKKGWLNKNTFSALFVCFVVLESVSAANVYMTGSEYYSFEKAKATKQVFELEDKINDDSFYRVKTTNKQFDVNNIGAMGYRSLSHYTSLTDRSYMYAMKKLGYSSYWMEVGSHCGTEMTDALFSVKYKIGIADTTANEYEYMTQQYGIYKRESFIGLGLVTDRDISAMDSFDDMDRFEVQEGIYDTLFAKDPSDKIMRRYEPTSDLGVIINDHGPQILLTPMEENAQLVYEIDVKGRQELYFDCFDKATSNLYEDIYESFTVVVNDVTLQTKYPSQNSNGLLRLGEFKDSRVTVKIKLLKNVQCTSFGVYGQDLDKLKIACAKTKSAMLDEEGGTITGSCEAESGEKCVLFVPYSQTLDIEVNGEKVNYEKAFGDFVVFPLNEGENEIRITAQPMGLTTGIVLSILGAVMCVGVWLVRKKVKPDEVVFTVCRMMTLAVGIVVLIAIYIVPVILHCIKQKV